MKKQKVYLCLENGQTFEGYRFGAGGEIQGELVFTTGMGGYIETLTDPSYYGQIVLQTFPSSVTTALSRKIWRAPKAM